MYAHYASETHVRSSLNQKPKKKPERAPYHASIRAIKCSHRHAFVLVLVLVFPFFLFCTHMSASGSLCVCALSCLCACMFTCTFGRVLFKCLAAGHLWLPLRVCTYNVVVYVTTHLCVRAFVYPRACVSELCCGWTCVRPHNGACSTSWKQRRMDLWGCYPVSNTKNY